MHCLYLTADQIGTPTGGGAVTYHESQALISVCNKSTVWHRDNLICNGPEPWGWDDCAVNRFAVPLRYDLAHVYAGTFSKTVAELRKRGIKVTYTAAAHDVNESRKEHQALGWIYGYPHITDPEQWKQYVAGYLAADVLICPSRHSEFVMRGFGVKNRIEVIPHGCHVPKDRHDLPSHFCVGYLGAVGPDKGLVYLLKAWKNLNYQDGSELLLAGSYSNSDYVQALIKQFDVSHVRCLGWMDNVSDFYNGISLYVQPSVTEGFGIEVLEAMAHARPVICSTGAGAADLVPSAWTFQPRQWDTLASKIDMAKSLVGKHGRSPMLGWSDTAEQHTWDKIKARYVKLWKELLED